jgi:hypothetical protein
LRSTAAAHGWLAEEAGIEAVVCFEAGDEEAACSRAGIEDGRWWQRNDF